MHQTITSEQYLAITREGDNVNKENKQRETSQENFRLYKTLAFY